MAALATSKSENTSHSWRFYYRPHDTWNAMYADCENAEESIEFEQYILEDDAVGHKFLELFIEKAKAGLKVFLICDHIGSSALSRSPLIKKLKQHGGKVHFYNNIKNLTVFTPRRWLPRTHTKTLLIDSRIAYAGGVCMSEHMRNWRDTHIRVTGPVIKQIRQAFDDIENRILHRKSKGIPRYVGEQQFKYLMNRPAQGHRAIYRELIRVLSQAEHTVYITSAYFFPSWRVLYLIRQAHARGVDVRVLVPSHSDVWLADWVCLSYTRRYLRNGLRLFHYQETVMHSKFAVIDDSWAMIGSTNFDVLSFFYNREGNIITTEKEAVKELKQQFFADLERSLEFTEEEWRKVPLQKKLLGYLGRILRTFLQ